MMTTNKGQFVTHKTDRVVLGSFNTQADADAGKGIGEVVTSITIANFNLDAEPGWTVSTAGVLAPPAQPVPTSAELKIDTMRGYRAAVSTAAYMFDANYHSHWANHGVGTAARLANTSKHFRSWVGYCWGQVDAWVKGASGAPTDSEMSVLLERLESELGGYRDILTWNVNHDLTVWTAAIAARKVSVSGNAGAVGATIATAGGDVAYTRWCDALYAKALVWS